MQGRGVKFFIIAPYHALRWLEPHTRTQLCPCIWMQRTITHGSHSFHFTDPLPSKQGTFPSQCQKPPRHNANFCSNVAEFWTTLTNFEWTTTEWISLCKKHPQILSVKFLVSICSSLNHYYGCCEDAGHEINDDERRVFEKINTTCCRNLLAILIVR